MSATFKPEDTRPFNLDHAKAGAPVCQRSGYPATILKFDVKGEFPIAGILVIDEEEEVGAWRSDGSFYDKGEDDLYDITLVMKPLAYLQGRPVHYGDELERNMGAGYIATVEAFPELDIDSGEFAWPETIKLKDHAPVATVTSAVTKADRDDFLSMFAENTIREVARTIRGKAGARITVEVVLSVIGETADHRIIQAVDTLKITSVTPPPAVPVENKAPEPALSLKPLRDYQQAAVDTMNQSFVDAILPGHEVTMVVGTGNPGAVIDEQLKAPITPVLVDTSKAPPVPVPDEDKAEKAFWTFDAMRKGYAQWKARPQSERDAFKFIYVSALHTAEHWRQMYEGVLAINVQRDDQIRQLTEANAALEDRIRAHLEDNAKLDRALDEASTEAARWMAEAKRLGGEVDVLVAQRDGHKNRVDELSSRISMIAAYVRNDAEAVKFQRNMSMYRAAVLSKVLD